MRFSYAASPRINGLAGLAMLGVLIGLALAGCGASAPLGLELHVPALQAVGSERLPLRVIATTSIIGDVVRQVGGELIQLEVLIDPGQDPHGFTTTAQTLVAVQQADVVLVNGWDLEEGLIDDLTTVAKDIPIVPVSAGITPRLIGLADAETDHPDASHESVDPHVWMSIPNVATWADTIARVLGEMDPGNAPAYGRRANEYRVQLLALETEFQAQLGSLPAERRRLVANHDAFGYFAEQYDFTLLGSLRPGGSTLSEPTAADLAQIVRAMDAAGVCLLFTDAAEDDSLAGIIAAELDHCQTVDVVALYAGGLGPPGSGADSYLGMMRSNLNTLMAALQ